MIAAGGRGRALLAAAPLGSAGAGIAAAGAGDAAGEEGRRS